jgi:hypothetical protein
MKTALLAVALVLLHGCALSDRLLKPGRPALVDSSREQYFQAREALLACSLRFAQQHIDSKLTATELATTAIGSCTNERAGVVDTGRLIAKLGYPGGGNRMTCRKAGLCLNLAQAALEADLASVRTRVMELIAEQTAPARRM